MVPLTGPTDSSSEDELCGATAARAIRTQDRATLGKSESLKVDGWITQVNESTRGFLDLWRSDLVNYLVRSVANDLSPKGLAQIRVDHYDPVRHITWIAPQIKMALANGDHERVASLQAELRGVDLSGANKTAARENARPSCDSVPKPRRGKRRADVSETVASIEEIAKLDG